MKDEQSTDTGVQETDLSGINDINFDDEDDSAPVTKDESKDESEETSEESTEQSEEETQETEESESEEQEESKDELSDEDKKKAFNREQAEKRIQERKERDLSIKEQQDKYLDESEDDRDLALRQLQIDAYNNRVESNTNKLTNAYEKAIKDFEILSSDDPDIKREVDGAIDAFQAMHVRLDSYGNPTEVAADFYQYLQDKADSIEKLTGYGVRKQASDKGRERSKAMTPPNRSPVKSSDTLMDELLKD